MIIRPDLTAIHRKSMSLPYKKILEYNLITSDTEILDYGCGHGYDVVSLKDKGFNIKGYDKYIPTHSNEFYNNQTYSVITCFYVLNTIASIDERISTITNILSLLKADGQAIFCVRSYREFERMKKTNYTKISDGILTSRNTFQKYFTEIDIAILFEQCAPEWELEFLRFDSNGLLFTVQNKLSEVSYEN